MNAPSLPKERLAHLRLKLDLDTNYIAYLQWQRLDKAIDRCVETANYMEPLYKSCLNYAAGRYLTQRLCWFYQKIFVYELNRHTGGADNEASFEAFIEHVIGEGVQLEIAERYAPLTVRVDAFLENFIDFVREHVAHWAADRAVLLSMGYIPFIAPTEIIFGLGDPHQGARSTIALVFGEETLYYKPRSLALDNLFAEFQARIASSMQPLKSLTRLNYGWQRGIQSNKPSGDSAASTFFYQVGNGLAILYLLSGTDIHYENIVSDEEGHPFFIDMEALFTQRQFVNAPNRDPVLRTSAEALFQGFIKDSIFNIGMVPYTHAREGSFAGIAGAQKIASPVSREVAVRPKRGNMRLERANDPIDIVSAVPTIDGVIAKPQDFVEEMAAGFSAALAQAIVLKKELVKLVRGGAWQSRQIYRNTYIYYLFLAESTHPVIASRPEAFSELLQKLRREHVLKPFLDVTFDSEIMQMHCFDIPIFLAQSSSTAIKAGSSEFQYFFERPVMDDVLSRIEGLDTCIIERQVDFIRCAYGANKPSSIPNDVNNIEINSIIKIIENRALIGGDDASITWTYCPPEDLLGEKIALTTLGPDIYSGIGGLLWLLSDAARLTGDKATEDLRIMACNTAKQFIDTRVEFCSAGALTGYHGLLWVLAYDALRRGAHDDWAVWRSKLCDPSLYKDIASCDVVEGMAGCLLQLVSIYELTGDSRLLTPAAQLVDRILLKAIHGDAGTYWMYDAMDRPLLGFGHGGSGIACALGTYAQIVQDEKLCLVVQDIFRFEDSHFNTSLGLWPDMRGDAPNFTTSWCNGLAGHVLARVHCRELLSNDQRAIFQIALDQFLRYAFDGENDSLCHGILGNVEVLFEAGRILNNQEILIAANQALEKITASGVFHSGWECDQANLGMFVGISGYGLAILRRKDPSIPSPLTYCSVANVRREF